jgi:hypothetical protein
LTIEKTRRGCSGSGIINNIEDDPDWDFRWSGGVSRERSRGQSRGQSRGKSREEVCGRHGYLVST